jgi:hypothetical protein
LEVGGREKAGKSVQSAVLKCFEYVEILLRKKTHESLFAILLILIKNMMYEVLLKEIRASFTGINANTDTNIRYNHLKHAH